MEDLYVGTIHVVGEVVVFKILVSLSFASPPWHKASPVSTSSRAQHF